MERRNNKTSSWLEQLDFSEYALQLVALRDQLSRHAEDNVSKVHDIKRSLAIGSFQIKSHLIANRLLEPFLQTADMEVID